MVGGTAVDAGVAEDAALSVTGSKIPVPADFVGLLFEERRHQQQPHLSHCNTPVLRGWLLFHLMLLTEW